jgi:hypothetical protein
MSFELPAFNLTCEIFTGPYLTRVSRGTSLCNLAWGKRVAPPGGQYTGGSGIGQVPMTLLLPAGTDIRDRSCNGQADMVEVPQGSGRWYYVLAVDDIGKGFANEHRGAEIFKAYSQVDGTLWAGLQWPTPIP